MTDKYVDDVAEVLQTEEQAPVKVEVVGTVHTQTAPALDGDLYSVTMPTIGLIENLAVGDARRSYLAATSSTAFYAATSRDQARSPMAALWPANVPLVIRHRGEVWVRATVADQVVSATVERWAD